MEKRKPYPSDVSDEEWSFAAPYLRTLLIHGARSVLTHAKEPGSRVEQMKKRRPLNVVIVALANKMARTIWAVLAHDRPYRKGYVSVKTA